MLGLGSGYNWGVIDVRIGIGLELGVIIGFRIEVRIGLELGIENRN
jgi:hypothetical protein